MVVITKSIVFNKLNIDASYFRVFVNVSNVVIIEELQQGGFIRAVFNKAGSVDFSAFNFRLFKWLAESYCELSRITRKSPAKLGFFAVVTVIRKHSSGN